MHLRRKRMEKPFLTIDEQMDLLRNRGMFVPGEAKAILMREGYYSIVNGYKEPFIDVGASRDAGDDRYLAGTTFEDLYGLCAFDRRLREITFHYLIRAEATARTAVAYSFADAHRNHSDYLAQSSYCTREEFEAYGKDPSEHLNELKSSYRRLLAGATKAHPSSSPTIAIGMARSPYGCCATTSPLGT